MSLFDWLDLLGVATFAASGVLVAARHRLDVFGALVVAFVTALGGGTLRDVLLGLTPVFWIGNTLPASVALGSALVAFTLVRFVSFPRRAMLVLDALGLGVFAALGAARAWEVGASWPVAAAMGMLSGSAGGAIRDVLCGEVPLVLRADVYATAALAGGALCALSLQFGALRPVALVTGAALTLLLRLAALRWKMQLPRVAASES